MDWFYIKDGAREGPIDQAVLQHRVSEGVISADTLVWSEGMAEWVPYARVAQPVVPASLGRCSLCGKAFLDEELIGFEDYRVCCGCKPVFLQQLRENAEVVPREDWRDKIRYGGFWRRAIAWVIDRVLMQVVGLAFGMLAGILTVVLAGLEQPIFIFTHLALGLIYLGYYIWMHGRYGATLGKMALGLKVVRPDGKPISYRQATGRFFASMLSGMILGIGYLMAVFDDEKKALHDNLCNTRVIVK